MIDLWEGLTPPSGLDEIMPKKLTTEEFIEKAKGVHGDRYDYSRVDYRGSKTEVKIICPKHGIFLQSPNMHTHINQKQGCRKCGLEKRLELRSLDTEEFIAKSQELHGNWCDYSLVKYKNNRTKVKIICPKHGAFWQSPDVHLRTKKGCPKCGRDIAAKQHLYNTQEFIKKAQEIHGNQYDYSLVKYKYNKTKVKIICPKHGAFQQSPNNHIQKQGCPQCGGTKQLSKKEFIAKAQEIHGNQYDYSLVKYKHNKEKVKIICSKHGTFWQSPHSHVDAKNGCPICKSSKGEKRIEKFLRKHLLNYTRQKKFNACKNKTYLPFDFYFQLEEHQFLIEYDGPQHFRPMKQWGGKKAFEQIKKNDQIKTQFAQDHGFILIRIPYTDFNRIEIILKESIEAHTGQPLEITPNQPQRKRKVAPLKGRQLNLL